VSCGVFVPRLELVYPIGLFVRRDLWEGVGGVDLGRLRDMQQKEGISVPSLRKY